MKTRKIKWVVIFHVVMHFKIIHKDAPAKDVLIDTAIVKDALEPAEP
jgi:hypothetical protein